MGVQGEIGYGSALDLRGKRVHFIGILGEGMQRAAIVAAECGAIVSGSDLRETDDVRALAHRGVRVICGAQQSLQVEADLVVVSPAVPADLGEVAEATNRGLEVIKYPEFVGRVMESRRGIGVAGTHGKSTTTALTAYLLAQAGMDPSYIVGADVPQLGGGSHYGTGEWMVAEACEYRRSFLYLEPEIGVITGVDYDHADYYFSFDDVVRAFTDFAEQVHEDGLLVLNKEDPSTPAIADEAPCAVETFCVDGEADWSARRVWRAKKRTNFDLYERGDLVGRVSMPLYGTHNIRNALAAISVARRCGVSYESILAGLDTFTGCARRLQLIGEAWGVPVLSDYAHHPREIEATLGATRQRYPSKSRIFCVFQPHQHSRTRAFLPQFAQAFSDVHMAIFTDIYGVRDSEEVRRSVSSLDLVREVQQHNRSAYYMPDFGDIEEFLAGEVVMNDVVLVMGAGNIWQLAGRIYQRIQEKARGGAVAA